MVTICLIMRVVVLVDIFCTNDVERRLACRASFPTPLCILSGKSDKNSDVFLQTVSDVASPNSSRSFLRWLPQHKRWLPQHQRKVHAFRCPAAPAVRSAKTRHLCCRLRLHRPRRPQHQHPCEATSLQLQWVAPHLRWVCPNQLGATWHQHWHQFRHTPTRCHNLSLMWHPLWLFKPHPSL